ncbi:MAG TPA: GNAT family N-acetyltransferase [Candidatus Saccharimonadales bacterium]|nr:GNAT family N-acetyltransferase [Candidatus Saccharimonadales bacterium]
MTALRVTGDSPWYGIDADALRFLELHEARAHEHPGRRVADLGDAVLLHDPADPEPFLNRLSALRLPDGAAEFDRRLGDLIRLFATIGRRPHLWLGAGFNTPRDLRLRLTAEGFAEAGGTYLMVLPGAARLLRLTKESGAASANGAARVERLGIHRGAARVRLLDQAADVLIEAFGVGEADRSSLARELDPANDADVCVVLVGDEAVAAGRRHTADGATYLSSIGTRAGWSGRGYGSILTRALVDDAHAAATGPVHLAVDARNDRARAMYQRIGFVVVGDRATAHVLQ